MLSGTVRVQLLQRTAGTQVQYNCYTEEYFFNVLGIFFIVLLKYDLMKCNVS